jgi:hypothetical protein
VSPLWLGNYSGDGVTSGSDLVDIDVLLPDAGTSVTVSGLTRRVGQPAVVVPSQVLSAPSASSSFQPYFQDHVVAPNDPYFFGWGGVNLAIPVGALAFRARVDVVGAGTPDWQVAGFDDGGVNVANPTVSSGSIAALVNGQVTEWVWVPAITHINVHYNGTGRTASFAWRMPDTNSWLVQVNWTTGTATVKSSTAGMPTPDAGNLLVFQQTLSPTANPALDLNVAATPDTW